ncbi:LysR family transcriptional regulator [Azospirillum sp.]|uniref:LysR family transcriptional regulator n=1 Tax=Azospirillum sp. TaxID=34012 RepID=UPI003D70C608
MRRPDLSDLDAFAAVARHRNFRRAAVERGVSASTLSDAVRALEERLGVRLLNRTTRSVTPTEAGQRLLDRLGPALDEVGEALDAVNGFRDTPTGTLRLNVPSAAAHLVLAPLVAPFLATHPGLRLEIVEDNSFVDVFAAGFDAGVRYDEALAKDMIAVPLGPPQRFAVAASPALLAHVGVPGTPHDLLERPCIRHRFLSGALPPWEFARDGETVKLSPEGPLIVTSADMAVRAAEDGVGFVHSFEGFLRPSLDSGRLVEVLEDWSDRFPGPSLYYPSRRHVPAPLRAFVEFVRAHRRRT